MEKIGDYIPLILIALTFIYSFAKKAGKKVAEEEAGKTTLPGGIPGNNIPIPQVKPKPQPVVSKPVEKKLPGSSRIFLENKAQPVIDEIEEDESLALDFTNVEELKKGIVYSEIFNRKY